MFKKTGKKVLELNEYQYEGVRFLLQRGSSDRLFLFFSSFSRKGEAQKYNYIKKIINNREDSFIFFLDSDSPEDDPRGTYFIGDKNECYLKSIIYIIKSEFYSNPDLDIYFFGSSKGGSGALLACLELGKGKVLINSPQIRIAEYLLNTNPKAISEINKTEQQLNNIIIDKIQKVTKVIDINISCGIEDDLHWFSHMKHLMNNLKENVNLNIIPTRGGHDGKALNDYSILIDAMINEKEITNNFKNQVEFFKNKNNFFFYNCILPKLKGGMERELDIDKLERKVFRHIVSNIHLIVLNNQNMIVKINGMEGISLTVYAKDIDNKILAKHNKYIDYEHDFLLKTVNSKRFNNLTVFIKINEINFSINLLKDQIQIMNVLSHFENDNEYLKYLSAEYISTTKRIIRSNDIDLLQDSHILPSLVDSSDAKLVVRNDIGYSFKTCITNALIKNYLTEDNRVLGLFSKKETSDFLKNKGFTVPIIYEYNVSLEKILNYEKCIIKPINGEGSKGVFVKNADEYLDLRDKKILMSYDDFKSKYNSYSSLSIIIEELVADDKKLARDVKVYCFYGKPILALEVIRDDNKNFYCYYDENFNIVDTGQYKNNELFEGEGFDDEIFKVAKEISLLVPLPFIRVDFLVAQNQYRLGEMTPIPGFYSRFNTYYDKKLGKEYLEAENRLKKDLLEGKVFDF